jgi:hypothetical protein
MLLMQAADVETYISKGIVAATSQEAAGLPGHLGLEGATEERLDRMGSQQLGLEDDD